jgi:uncharacterized protein YbaR (Trm112 family)
MFDKNLLDVLCCPETRTPLKMADEGLIQSLNDAISAGTLKNGCGEKVTEPLVEALVTEDGKRVYPIREGIPVLLSDEAILFSMEEK